MSIDVEVNLAIPRIKNPVLGENGYPIDNGSVRFMKLIQVVAIPKPGTMLPLTTDAGHEFSATVSRSDWNEERAIFVVSCKYSNRSIPADQCAALFSDPGWTVKPLL